MKSIYIFLIFLSSGFPMQAQYYYDAVDSVVAQTALGEDEWLIGLVIDDGNNIPLYDSLGNLVSQDRSGFYLFLKKDNKCFLYRYRKFYDELSPAYKLQLLSHTEIREGGVSTFTSDSIELARGEGIYPYIYFADSLKVYGNISPSLHETHYRMCFRKRDYYTWTAFVEFELRQTFSSVLKMPDNLNFQYNSKTFIFRAFYACLAALKREFGF